MDLHKETEWIRKAQNDPSAFSVLYEANFKKIFVFVHKRVRDKDTAGDIVQQVFLKAMLNIGRYKFQGYPFSAWLYRIAYNEMNMLHRKSSKFVEVALQESDAQEIMSEIKGKYSEENCEKVLQALTVLETDLSSLIELRFMQHLSFQEIGAILHVEEATAKMRVYRAIEKLKKRFLELNPEL